jgi:hypothetical protein
MERFLSKYALGVGGLIFAFANFVACGSQLYRVSVEDDLEASQVARANPEADNPDSTLYGIHAVRGWQQIPIPFRFGQKMTADQKIHFLAAIKKWEWAVGKKLFAYQGTHDATTGDTFDDLYGSLSDDVNGQYLDDLWSKTDKPDYVLATTIWNNNKQDYQVITKADIRFNHQNYIIGDSLRLRAEDNRDVVDMQSLALHELGHLLGLAHVEEKIDDASVMNPSLFIGEGLTSRELSRGDIERAQLVYGCSGQACDIDSLLEESEQSDITANFTSLAQSWFDNGDELSPDDAVMAH